jgi:hypothetical protein
LEALSDEYLEGSHDRSDEQKREHHERQHEHRPEQHAKGDRVDQCFDRCRHDDGKQADSAGKCQQRQQVGTLEPE